MKQTLTIALITLVLSSCTKQRKLGLPELNRVNFLDKTETTFEKPSNRKNYVAYISNSPEERLYQIEPAITKAISKGMGYYIYIEATSEEVRTAVENLNFKYDVYLDSTKQFKEMNNETIKGYNGYLINRKQYVIGSPMITYRSR